ncbi:MAG: hypothetical protein ACLVG5_07700 [Clostridium sp.]
MAELIDLKELEERVILIAVNVGDERRRQLLWMNWKNWLRLREQSPLQNRSEP